MWAIPTGTSSALKKKSGKESQYMVSHPELDSEPPIGSNRESGRDMANQSQLAPFFHSSESDLHRSCDLKT